MIYLGVDPGASGGIAALTVANDKVNVSALPMPATETDLWDILKEYRTLEIRHPGDSPNVYAVLEKVGGVVSYTAKLPSMGASMFQFGRQYGLCWMALIAAGIPFDLVAPQTWQKEYALKRDKGETPSQWKGKCKGVAQRLFPHIKVTLAIADALLLAEYARKRKGYDAKSE